MEMSYDEIRGVEKDIDRGLRQEKPADAAADEQGNETQGKQRSAGDAQLQPYRLPIQIKVRMVEGIVITSVGKENINDESGFIPLTNMWCPHTM